MEINVEITRVLEAQKLTTKNGEMVKHMFIGKTEGDYPKEICFEVMNEERWNKMKDYVVVGKTVKASFDISSREWNGKFFTSINCFSVYGGGGQQQQAPVQQQSAVPNAQPSPAGSSENTDNLPF